MVERVLARSLSIENIENQILKFYSGDVQLQTILIEFQKDPRAFSIFLDIITRHAENFSVDSLPLILFCSQTLSECDKIYYLCNLDCSNLNKEGSISKERKEAINELERVINLLESLKSNTQIFPSLRFLFRCWLRLKLIDNLSRKTAFDVIELINSFKSTHHFKIELLAILAQEIYNDKFKLSIEHRNELARKCIPQTPKILEFLGVSDPFVNSVYSDLFYLHIEFLDMNVHEDQCELPNDVDKVMKSSLSTIVSLKLIDRLFEQNPIPIYTIINLISLCPLDSYYVAHEESDVTIPFVNDIILLVISNLLKLYNDHYRIFKTTLPILLHLSYQQLPYLISHQYGHDVITILNATLDVLCNDSYTNRDVILNFWINLKKNVTNLKGIERLTAYFQKIVILFYNMPLKDNRDIDFLELYSFRETASTLLTELGTVLGQQYVFSLFEQRLDRINETELEELCDEAESILFILNSVTNLSEGATESTCITKALNLLCKLKFPNQGYIALLTLISVGKLICSTAEYIGNSDELFVKLFALISDNLLVLILKLNFPSHGNAFKYGEDALSNALLALSYNSRKVVNSCKEDIKSILLALSSLIQNMHYSIDNRCKFVKSVGAIISYLPVHEMKVLFSNILDNLYINANNSINSNHYIQLYLSGLQSVHSDPDCLESELVIIKIIEDRIHIIEGLLSGLNEGILERLSELIVFIINISKEHTERSPLFHWGLKVLGLSHRLPYASCFYKALKNVLLSIDDHSDSNWACSAESLLPSLVILEDSIMFCCVSDVDKNHLYPLNCLSNGLSSVRLLIHPDDVEACIDCLNVALCRLELTEVLLDKSEFNAFFESLLVIIPYLVHPKILHKCIIVIKLIASSDYKNNVVFEKKTRLLSKIMKRNDNQDKLYTNTFKLVESLLAIVMGGISGMEGWIDIIAECILGLIRDFNMIGDVRNAVNTIFDSMVKESIDEVFKCNFIENLNEPTILLQHLIQLHGLRMWKR